MVDLDKLEHLLMAAAKTQQPLTYAQILTFFERRTTPITVRALCGDLGKVCRKLEAQGWPDVACLVVRKSDRLPGDGYFQGARDRAGDPVPPGGSRARAYVRTQQEKAFRHAELNL